MICCFVEVCYVISQLKKKGKKGHIFYFEKAGSGKPVLLSQRFMFQAFEGALFIPLSLSMLLFTGN